MWWRRRTGDGSRNRAGLRRLVRGGREPGLLAYDGGCATGWVAVAPREEYGHRARAKRQGVAGDLLHAAVRHAFARGAAAIEAYPHVRGDSMGVPSMFERLGFEAVGHAGPRTVVRLST
jgi:ribosomal protein S18 acetylase RimI-like enzyme